MNDMVDEMYTFKLGDSFYMAPKLNNQGALHLFEADYSMHTFINRQKAIELVKHLNAIFQLGLNTIELETNG